MSVCKFCGNSAGLFRQKHDECETRYSEAIGRLSPTARDAATGMIDVSTLVKATEKVKDDFVQEPDVRLAIVGGWEAVDQVLEDGVLDHVEEKRLVSFLNFLDHELSFDQGELDVRGAYSKIVKSAVLRDIMEGKLPARVSIEGSLPFNFQKGEQLVWVFREVEYIEDKTRREYVGRSAGVSIRIAKGVYYRTGAFKGHPVERTERVSLGQGLLSVTTKHIYFAGAKSFRVRHDKIVTYTPFSDGVGIVKDTATAKPQIFVTGDGWFIYNLLTNIAQL